MKNRIEEILVVFMAMSLVQVMARPAVYPVIEFVAATALLGFLIWLKEHRQAEVEELRAYFDRELREIKSRVEGAVLGSMGRK